MMVFYRNENLKEMKHILLFALFFMISFTGFGQDKEAMKKIESARIALITERLGLSPEQAEKFWPVYREYNMQRMQLRQELRETRQEAEGQKLTEDQSKALMQKAMDLKQRELNLDNQYAERMLAVISSQQILQLRNAEKDFQQMLLRRIQDQRQQQQQNQQMMQRREMLRDRKNN
jgi:hypothetical protein